MNHSRRPSMHPRLVHIALALGALAEPLAAQPAEDPAPPRERAPAPIVVIEPTEADGEPRTIDAVVVEYQIANPDLPPEALLLEAVLRVTPSPEGRLLPRPEWPIEEIRLADVPELESPRFYDGAIPLFSRAVVQRLQALGLIGVYVEPDPNEFALVDGKVVDLRPAGQTSITLLVTTGVVTELRTIGTGNYLPEEERIDNPAHDRIRERSPVKPRRDETGEALETPAPEDGPRPTNLLRRDLIDDYIFLLNRHPGRRVDVALAATGAETGAVALDYVVTENRPWFLYAQAANNGTSSTDDWRERFGFVHNQLTGADDIFSIDYVTANFDKLNSINASYQRPVNGSDRLDWRVYGGWYEYTAADVGLGDFDFDGRGYSVGGEIIWNFVQDRDLFVDLVAGARFENVRVDNEPLAPNGDENFFLPYAGLRVVRQREASVLYGAATIEANMSGLADTDEDGVNLLGRTDVDNSWVTLQFEGVHSFYLEPLLAGSPEKGTTLAHEVALSFRGQLGMGYRLPPNYQQIAGGLYTVRGYPEAIAAGDSVLIASAEYRFHVPRSLEADAQPGELFGRPFRFAPQYQYGPTDWDLILRAFVDFGRTFQNDRLSFERNQTLVGAGVGVELQLSRHFSARVDLGVALHDVDGASGDTSTDAGDTEVHLVFTIVF